MRFRCIFRAFFSFICATNYYQILNGRIFLHFLAGGLVVGVGIGFALLAHPWLGFLCKKSGNNFHCFLISCGERGILALASDFVDYEPPLGGLIPSNTKKGSLIASFFLRRERDSNPRYLSVRRFSRPVQSTTLPPLQGLFFNKNVVSSCLMVQRYIKKIYHASKMEKNLNIS